MAVATRLQQVDHAYTGCVPVVHWLQNQSAEYEPLYS